MSFPRHSHAAAVRRRTLAAAHAVVGLAVACGGGTPTEAGGLRGVALSGDRVGGITVTVAPSRATVSPGDTVAFTVSIANGTDARVQVGVQCGPAADVVVTPPQGAAVSVLAVLLGGDGAFTCELGPQHFVEARATQTSVLQWRAPAAPGTYEARAGLRRGDGLGNLSAAVRVVVQ